MVETSHPAWMPLLLGLTFSLVVGAIVVPTFQSVLDSFVGLERRHGVPRVPPSLTGHIERLLFTLIIAFEISGAPPAMIAWIAVKMAANWSSPEAQSEEAGVKPTVREVLNRRFSALLTSAVSLTVAVIGGLIALCRIPSGQSLIWSSVGLIVVSFVARYLVARTRKRRIQQSGAA